MKFKHVIFYFTGTGRVLLNAHEPVVQIISDNMEKTVVKISNEVITIDLNDVTVWITEIVRSMIHTLVRGCKMCTLSCQILK